MIAGHDHDSLGGLPEIGRSANGRQVDGELFESPQAASRLTLIVQELLGAGAGLVVWGGDTG
jgi:hypothetical protein